MNETIRPWARGPFDLILHAEEHYFNGEDFDRCIALICFDNSIEISISTYLSLHPYLRDGKRYPRQDMERWQHDYHSKLDFLDFELNSRGLPWAVDRREIILAHDCRNEQYHGGTSGVPNDRALEISRRASKWVFSLLFGIEDIEQYLEVELQKRAPAPANQRSEDMDRLIDQTYGIVEVAGQIYGASEVLFAVDPTAYLEIGEALLSEVEEDEVAN